MKKREQEAVEDLKAQLQLLAPLAAMARELALQVARFSLLCRLYSSNADRFTKIELMDDMRYILGGLALLKKLTQEKTSGGLHAQLLRWYAQATCWLEEQLLQEGAHEHEGELEEELEGSSTHELKSLSLH